MTDRQRVTETDRHTHTQRQAERERGRERREGYSNGVFDLSFRLYQHTQLGTQE